jgi:hypothetical protein
MLWAAGRIAIADAQWQRLDYCGVNTLQPVVVGPQEGSQRMEGSSTSALFLRPYVRDAVQLY